MATEDYFVNSTSDLLSADTGPVATQPLPVLRGQQRIAVDQPPPVGPPAAPQLDRGYAMELEAGPEMALNYAPTSGLDTITKPTVLPLVAAGAAGVAGGIFGGVWGVGAGILLTGAAVNTYRLISNKDQEKTAHGVFALVAAAAGGYMAYKAFGRKGNSNDRQ